MSYSFPAQGATKEALIADIKAKMALEVERQPIHAVDQALPIEYAEKSLALLGPDAEGVAFTASVSGYVSGSKTETGYDIGYVSCSVYVARKPAEQA